MNGWILIYNLKQEIRRSIFVVELIYIEVFTLDMLEMRLNSGRLGFRMTDTYLQRIRKKDHRLRTETEKTWHGIRGNNLKQKN